MMEKDKLRKADLFSGVAIFLFGAWIARQATKMPMKDSWGGVQNVWFVSPALFPLFVGLMVMVLGILLCRTAIKSVGAEKLRSTARWLLSRDVIAYLSSDSILRFYAIALLFLSLVYVNVPRIDFFVASVLFLVVFVTQFYFDDDVIFKKLFFFYLAGTLILVIFFAAGLDRRLTEALRYPGDIVGLGFILAYCLRARLLVRADPQLRKRFRTAVIVAVAAPFVVAPIFKYFLLVPLPTEGLIVALLDKVWYMEF